MAGRDGTEGWVRGRAAAAAAGEVVVVAGEGETGEAGD